MSFYIFLTIHPSLDDCEQTNGIERLSLTCLKTHDFYGLLSGLIKNVYLCNHETKENNDKRTTEETGPRVFAG